MKRVLGHCLAAGGVLAAAIGVTSACTHDDSSFYITNVLFPTPVTVGQSCTFSADPNQAHILGPGTMDVGLGRFEYAPVFLVANQLTPEQNQQQLQTETSIINVQGAVVRITDAAGNQLNTFTTQTSTTVLPASGSIPGYASVSTTIVDANTSRSLNVKLGEQVSLVTYTKFFGHTLGGNYIESNEYSFPVDVCNGCLVLFSSTDINTSPGYAVPNCLQNGTGTSASLPVPCFVGQDTAIDLSLIHI